MLSNNINTTTNERIKTIQYNGDVVYFDSLENINFSVENIVNSQSKVCRFNGHTSFHYSNLRHMYMCSCICQEQDLKLACLLHDVHEVIIGDIMSPLSHWMSTTWKEELDELKFKLDKIVATQFNCPELIDPECRQRIKYYDDQITNIEGWKLIKDGHLHYPKPELHVEYLVFESNARVIHNWKNKLKFLMRKQESVTC